jgi:hypothetical protein
MKTFLGVIALFFALTAYSQSIDGYDMESRIHRGLLDGHDRDLLTVQPQKPNEVRNGRVSYDGIFVELVKTDNRLQLINPAAPVEYGASWDNVVVDRSTGLRPEGSRSEGLNLFSIRF